MQVKVLGAEKVFIQESWRMGTQLHGDLGMNRQFFMLKASQTL